MPGQRFPGGKADAVPKPAAFPHTCWSLVRRAGRAPDTTSGRALDDLLRLYCPVLKKHLVRHLNFAPHAADDLVQDFVVHRILGKNTLARAEAARGRFRVFLLKAFTNFVIGEIRKRRARKRAPHDENAVRLDEFPDAVATDAPFHHSLDVEWARRLMALAIGRMQQECTDKGRGDLWEVFSCRVLEPALDQAPVPSYDNLVQRFGFASPTQASNLLITAKRMFRRALEQTVRDTVASEAQVEEEIRDIKAILTG
jgi:DNA-directed RNA polymerase specialized sigma24 family protein